MNKSVFLFASHAQHGGCDGQCFPDNENDDQRFHYYDYHDGVHSWKTDRKQNKDGRGQGTVYLVWLEINNLL